MSSETGLDAEGLDAYRREVSRLVAENKLLRAAADPAKVGAVGDLVKHATRLVQIERDDARAERDAANATITRVRAVHVISDMGECADCRASWPCPTIRALDASGGTEGLDLRNTGPASGGAESTEETPEALKNLRERCVCNRSVYPADFDPLPECPIHGGLPNPFVTPESTEEGSDDER